MTMIPMPIAAGGSSITLPLLRSYEITTGPGGFLQLTASGANYAQFGGSLTVPAAVGDRLLIGANGAVTGTHSSSAQMDVATMNGTPAPVNWVGGSGGSGANGGISGWLVTQPLGQNPIFGAPVPYTVQAGDVFSGNVTLQPYAYCPTIDRQVFASASQPFWFYCLNMRTA